jgi:hypothetical protein
LVLGLFAKDAGLVDVLLMPSSILATAPYCGFDLEPEQQVLPSTTQKADSNVGFFVWAFR